MSGYRNRLSTRRQQNIKIPSETEEQLSLKSSKKKDNRSKRPSNIAGRKSRIIAPLSVAGGVVPPKQACREDRSRSKEKHAFSERPVFSFGASSKNSWLQSDKNSLLSEGETPMGISKDYNLVAYIETLINKLAIIRSKQNDFSKEITYTEILRFVTNCESVELDYEFLLTTNIVKYLNTAYMILLAINDINSVGYQQLLPKLSKLVKHYKKKIITQVLNLTNY